jgi:hypothetical protein
MSQVFYHWQVEHFICMYDIKCIFWARQNDVILVILAILCFSYLFILRKPKFNIVRYHTVARVATMCVLELMTIFLRKLTIRRYPDVATSLLVSPALTNQETLSISRSYN